MQKKCRSPRHGGRVAHQVSDGAEAVQIEALADEQAKMIAGPLSEHRKQTAEAPRGDPVLGILNVGERTPAVQTGDSV